ncbi:glycosyltransferase [Echinicola sp. CAU 1574]|uniref:Glycosyltransferase n=1 Tax=Echinicola arenosa TaxID=2774144 RepID=A0ABR9AS40_9BACT|nr:glycosyltransferase [Echinicola arenosa]MBD8490444.1 glycosyltransferase [Echinicola arenosa]
MDIKISVIIPAYNREKFIGRAIESVLDQSIQDFELIVVDDQSSDDTLGEIVRHIDERIKVIQTSKNGGNAVARNEGVRNSSGDLIFFLDSDDFYDKNYLKEMIDFIHVHGEHDFFWCGINLVDESARKFGERFWTPNDTLPSNTFFDLLQIGTNNGICFKRKVFDSIGYFDESIRAAVDRDFLLRVSKSFSGVGLKKFLVNCTIGEHDSVRKNYENQANAYHVIVQKHNSVIKSELSRKKNWFHKCMWLHFYAGNRLRAMVYFFKVPFNFTSTFLFLVFSFLPIPLGKKIHQKFGSKGIQQ